MRAPFCNESADLCPDDKGIIGSENESDNEIHAIERSLGKSHGIKSAMFGICLDDLMGISSTQVGPQIPFILSRLCQYIETHGLYQKSLFVEGEENNVVENLKVEFIECGDAPLETAGTVACAAKLLIIFFEDLPEPLIPGSLQSDLIKDMEKLSINHPIDCISSLKVSVAKLSDSAYQVLKYLSRFLLKVACHKEYNGMSSDNLATIFGPLLFRPSSNDPLVLHQLKTIVSCFVQDYQAIFEDIVCQNEDNLILPVKSLSPTCRQLPCPSSVMPVATLSPLSVVIPLMETSSSENAIDQDRVPILLIERKSDNTNEARYTITSDSNKDKIGITRKRKERRPSGEDTQPRSSSEERPNSNALLALVKMDQMRRCNSHEEVMEDIKMSFEEDNLFTKHEGKGDASYHVASYLSNAMELVVNEKNHSPQPPNPKRREVDTVELIMESSDRWKYHNLSKFSDYKNPSSCSDVYFRNNSKQNPIVELSAKVTMECDSMDGDEVLDGENEFHDNKKVGIPRSASCPISKVDTEESSESETSSLSLSWSMLFEDSEPVRSENPLNWSPSKQAQDSALLSPSVHKLRNSNYYEAPLSPSAYRSYLSHRSSHLDPSVPPSPPVEQEDFAKKLVESSGISDSIKHLTKKIHSIKRHLKKFDEKFEAECGYKPSHAEKSNNPEAKKLLSDLYRARKELKALKEEAHLEHVSPASSSSWYPSQRGHILEDTTNHFQENGKDKKPTIEDSFGTTLKSLAEDRRLAKRPELVDEMSTDQVKDEKYAIQKALLEFESIHGKPFSRDERDTIRPLYDRYRCVKKLLVRSGSFPGSVSKNKELCSELQPILEHETMDFPSREHRNSTEDTTSVVENPNIEESKEPIESPILKEETKGKANSCVLAMKYDNSNFHELPLSELIFQMQKVKSEKRHLRKILKEFETEFMRLNGRKVQKEDKAPVDTLYGEYKHVKARLKLLEALISKHDQHQLM